MRKKKRRIRRFVRFLSNSFGFTLSVVMILMYYMYVIHTLDYSHSVSGFGGFMLFVYHVIFTVTLFRICKPKGKCDSNKSDLVWCITRSDYLIIPVYLYFIYIAFIIIRSYESLYHIFELPEMLISLFITLILCIAVALSQIKYKGDSNFMYKQSRDAVICSSHIFGTFVTTYLILLKFNPKLYERFTDIKITLLYGTIVVLFILTIGSTGLVSTNHQRKQLTLVGYLIINVFSICSLLAILYTLVYHFKSSEVTTNFIIYNVIILITVTYIMISYQGFLNDIYVIVFVLLIICVISTARAYVIQYAEDAYFDYLKIDFIFALKYLLAFIVGLSSMIFVIKDEYFEELVPEPEEEVEETTTKEEGITLLKSINKPL